MQHSTLLLILALVFLGLLALAVVVWAVWVRRFVKQSGARTASPYSLAALFTDFCTGLNRSRGRLPWSLKLFALILGLLVADAVLALLLVLLGT